ncbi:MAG: ester cyclase [Myxococcales bacterium]
MHTPERIAELATEAFNGRDAHALLALWSEHLRYEGPDGVCEGRAAMLEREHNLWRAFPDVKVAIRCFCSGPDKVVFETTFEGSHSGPLVLGDRQVPPTGRPLKLTISAHATLENGLIRHERVYFDRLSLLDQLGLV